MHSIKRDTKRERLEFDHQNVAKSGAISLEGFWFQENVLEA